MSEKRTRLSNGDKMAIFEAIRTPGFKREDIMKQNQSQLNRQYDTDEEEFGELNELDPAFREPSCSVLLTPRKRKRL